MQFERLMRVMKQYQLQILNMIEEQVQKSVYQIKAVRFVLQVLWQNCLKGQIN